MSLLGEYVLSQGTWASADRAAAVQMLMLARAGYVRVSLKDGRAVYLVRTTKPDHELSHEEQFLLRAVFGTAKTIVLDRPQQKPVAQSAITVARARLAKDGFLYQLSPRALQRRLFWGYLFTTVVTAVCVGLAVGPMMGGFIAFVAVLPWMPYNVSIRRTLRGRNVLYKRKGRRGKRSASWRDALSVVALLDSRGQHTWFDNLPTAWHESVEALNNAATIMAAALNQRFEPKKGYPRNAELWRVGLDGAYEQLAELGDAVRGNAVSYDGFTGGDGGGGDGDGGGDGGDGGGDG